MTVTVMAFLLDRGPYVPDLVSPLCYWVPPIAIVIGSILARRRQATAAWIVAIAAAVVVAWRVRYAIAHPRYYQDTVEWIIVGFSALFPLFCIARYVCAASGPPNHSPGPTR